MKPKRDDLLMKLGAARQQTSAAWRLVDMAPRRRGLQQSRRRVFLCAWFCLPR